MLITPPLPSLPGSFDAHYPVLLLPVSVQVKFVRRPSGSPKLLVRLYPDQLSVTTHEAPLTAAEQAAGATYWQGGATVAQPDADRWRALVARFGVPRAQWILRQTVHGTDPADAAAASWEQPARAQGLPHHFSVLLYRAVPDGADLPDSPAQRLLFADKAKYKPDATPRPTSEFLYLKKTADGATISGPLALGPDPLATADADDTGGIDARNRWTVNFTEAVQQGMALEIDLDEDEFAHGFQRLVVLGVCAPAGATGASGHTQLAQLLHDHAYTSGVQLVAQGTPTNNTDEVAAGFSSHERTDADASLPLLSQPLTFDAGRDWAQRPDAQHLATALGLAEGDLPALAGAHTQHDTAEAQTFGRALWPATYGYFLEEMLRPLLTPAALDWTRRFFEAYVLARGPLPALRVGAQPYGVLPTTRFSAWEVIGNQVDTPFATQLQAVLGQLDAAWTERLNPQPGLYPSLLPLGQQAQLPEEPSPTADLLTTLGLDATSGAYYQRYLIGPVLAEALSLYAQSQPQGPSGTVPSAWTDAARTNGHYVPTTNPLYQEFARLLDPTNTAHLQRDRAGDPVAAPPIFDYTFQLATSKLADAFADEPAARRQEGALVDDQPLSETAFLTGFVAVTGATQALTKNPDRPFNYVDWLATADFDALRREDFSAIIDTNNTGNLRLPNALLYRLLRQAVLLAFWAAAKRYLAAHPPGTGPLTDAQLYDDELFNITTTGDVPRWAWLYKTVNGHSLAEEVLAQDDELRRHRAAVAALAALPTARLERLLAEHLDLGSYRLDAWRLAPVAERLRHLRDAQPVGSHLGAFGWLEDLRPQDQSALRPDGTYADPDNLGYVHAPTPAHATAAALLRQGYKSRQLTADPLDPAAGRMAVDVSSRRVRAALALLDGLRGGSSLGELLGQRFERAVLQHGGTADGQPYGSFLTQLRAFFPLAEGQALVAGPAQAAPQGVAFEQAARQVLDGAALLRAAAHTPAYPYGVPRLPAAGSAFAAFIAGQVAQLTDELDALGDLAVSEGVFQAARGNTERAAAVLDSVAKGQFPLAPEVVQPPQRGLSFTQRVLVQLPALPATPGPWEALPATPRALAAPRLNAWLQQFFPAPQALDFGVGYQLSDGTWPKTQALSLAQANLQPIDLLYLLDEASLQAGSALDRLLAYALAPLATRPTGAGAVLGIDYATSPAAVALRQRLPQLARLRQLLGGARPARLADVQAPSQAAAESPDAGSQLTALAGRLQTPQAELTNWVPAPPVVEPALTAADFYRAALYGVAEALPGLVPGADLAAAARALRPVLRTRLAAAQAAATPPKVGAAVPLASRLQQAAALFGPAFRPDVEFDFADADARAAYAQATSAPAAAALLGHYPDPPLALQEWLHGLGAVREPLNHLDKVLLLQSLLRPDTEPAQALRPSQLAASPAGAAPGAPAYWLGLRWPAGYTPPADALSLVQWLPDTYQASDVQCALWLDEWTETLPQAAQPTAVALHYDQPNSAAPQAVLLVVSPRATPTQWTTEDLLGAVNETLDLAKKRTVEPASLAFTPLATVLPAVVAPVAQQAVTFTLDLGVLTGKANFGEEVLQVPNPLP